MTKLAFTKPQPERLPEYLGRQIARTLVRGELPPGEAMPGEASLMETFDVSRAVVREALRSLEQRGMIETSQGRPSTVREERHWDILDPVVLASYREEGRIAPLLREFLWIRLRLEPEIAAEAATSGSEEFLADLGKILERMEELVDQPTPFFEQDMAFHYRVTTETGNRVLSRLMRTIGDLFNVSRDPSRDAEYGPPGALAYHREIYEALARTDPEEARRAMRAHLEWTAERMLRRLGD